MFSIHSQAEWEANHAKWMKKAGFTDAEAKKNIGAMRGLTTLFKLTQEDMNLFPRGADANSMGPIRSNDEYHRSFDASAMCVKRLDASATAAYVQSRLKRTLTGGEKTALVALFRENDLPAPCLYCYVESPRSKASGFVKDGLDILNGKAYPLKDDGSFKWAETTRAAFDEARAELKQLGKTTSDIDPNILTDPAYARLPKSKAKIEATPKVYDALRIIRDASKQNAPKLYEEYDGQISRIRPEEKAKIQARAGLRFFSSSDFQAEHVVDLMQAFHDMEAGQWLSHGYTKVPEYVRIFGRTGQKINMSIFAQETDGRIGADTWQGNKWEDARTLRNKFPDVGSIMVGSSEKIIGWSLNQPWIDFVIPFHHSGMEKSYQVAQNWQDFTSTRSERSYPFTVNDKIKEGFGSIDMSEIGVKEGISNAEGTRRYLTLALERRVSPMFVQFAFKDFKPTDNEAQRPAANAAAMARWKAMIDAGKIDWSQINPNYFKLKKDYARTDTPFNPVKADFDMKEAKKVVNSYLAGTEVKGEANETIGDRLIKLVKSNPLQDLGVLALNALRTKTPMMEGSAVFKGVPIKTQKSKQAEPMFSIAAPTRQASDSGLEFLLKFGLPKVNTAGALDIGAIEKGGFVGAMQKLKSLETRLEAGKLTGAEYRYGIQQVIRAIERRNEAQEARQESNGRRRGADWIVAQLRRGVADGTIPRNEVHFAEWLLAQNPNLASDLGISISGKSGAGTTGHYNPLERVIKLFTSGLGDGTAVHEILHHAERMMPPEVQAGIIKAWEKAWDKAMQDGTPAVRRALSDMLMARLGNTKSKDRMRAAFNSGTLNYDAHYQLFSPSEFWAVNGSRILADRNVAGSWMQKAAQWLKEFVQRVKGLLGLPSDAPIIKALQSVLNGDGTYLSQKMLAEADYGDLSTAAYSNIVRNAQQKVVEFFGNPSLDTFNLYDRSIATQYQKAQKDPHYGKVYSLLMDMQNHVSMAAIRPAELAPGVLTRVDDVSSAASAIFSRKNKAALEGASQAVFKGTLNGASVMEGKVWTDAELVADFGLDATGIALYKQTRAAIDASLDEVAAAEAYALVQMIVPRTMRAEILAEPTVAAALIVVELGKQIKMMGVAIKSAGNDQQAASMEAGRDEYRKVLLAVKKIFTTVENLKAAGYAPLMRFGKYEVMARPIDPQTGNLERDDDGHPISLFYGRYESQREAHQARRELEAEYEGRDDVQISAGKYNETKNELYQGVDVETLQIFSEAIGAKNAADAHIRLARSDRSALKRRLERKGTPGFSTDLPRSLASFITSNARHSSQQFYMQAVTRAVKYIPRVKGDVQNEAQKLTGYVLNPKDSGAVGSSLMFAWFLGGSPAAAAVNMTQPLMQSLPYLSQWGAAKAAAELAKAVPAAMGRKQIQDKALRDGLKQASLEGVVDAQEIFHLYATGSQQLAFGNKSQAAMTLWSSMFAGIEGFNRRVTFIAAWNVAQQTKQSDPYAFAIKAVNETQGIYNKVNRPNWARSGPGRAIFTFKTYSIGYMEMMHRMWKSGPEGKRAVMMMMAIMFLAAGEEGLPGAKFLDDMIDTLGQWFGMAANMRRWKREHAYKLLGKELGNLALYGASSQLPLDFGGRLGLGNLIPGSDILKPSAGIGNLRAIAEILGPTVGAATQVADFASALADGNVGKAFQNLAPKAIRDLAAAVGMVSHGYAVDMKGNRTVDVGKGDAAAKAIGFNPTTIAENTRKAMPVQQDEALLRVKRSSIVGQWARALVDGDDKAVEAARQRWMDWNKNNPELPMDKLNDAVQDRKKRMQMDKDTRVLKAAPKSARGAIGLQLAN